MYSKILNPKTKEWVNINSSQAKRIIKDYLNFLIGGAAAQDDDMIDWVQCDKCQQWYNQFVEPNSGEWFCEKCPTPSGTRTTDFFQTLIKNLNSENKVIQWDGESNNISIDMANLHTIYDRDPKSYIRLLNLKGFTKIAHVVIEEHPVPVMNGRIGIIEYKSRRPSTKKDTYRVYFDGDDVATNVQKEYVKIEDSTISYYGQIPDSKSFQDYQKKKNARILVNPQMTRPQTPPLMSASQELTSPLSTTHNLQQLTSPQSQPVIAVPIMSPMTGNDDEMTLDADPPTLPYMPNLSD